MTLPVFSLLISLLSLPGLLLTACSTETGIAPVGPEGSARDTLRILSFNIRYDNPEDGPDAWPHRKEAVADMIRSRAVDVAGLQEALKGQIDDLQTLLPGYAWLGVGREDGMEQGEFAPIFYRRDRLDTLRWGTFWLSETPDIPGSRSWDAALERIATWAVLRDRQTSEAFLAVNTHFDHRGAEARTRSAELIVESLNELATGQSGEQDDAGAGNLPVVLTGDFNAGEDSAPYAVLTDALSDALYASEQPHEGPMSTWNGFEAIVPGRRIDYIFVRRRRARIRSSHSPGHDRQRSLPVRSSAGAGGGWVGEVGSDQVNISVHFLKGHAHSMVRQRSCGRRERRPFRKCDTPEVLPGYRPDENCPQRVIKGFA